MPKTSLLSSLLREKSTLPSYLSFVQIAHLALNATPASDRSLQHTILFNNPGTAFRLNCSPCLFRYAAVVESTHERALTGTGARFEAERVIKGKVWASLGAFRAQQ
eukprot:TRINITY_DN23959_c0_g1_i1.p1 TRINITY_DN23959_c0_g1~~TRINITY_DN23959_c0_g1_i1.p1  ORF type:complete len:106 (-),score=2.76 TRINITY_DN23959_c0_g1_i1:248-565(-)